jgi:hypothetical protein
MSYRRELKLLRRAQKLATRQQRQLAELELTGLTAVTLHAHAQHLTIALCHGGTVHGYPARVAARAPLVHAGTNAGLVEGLAGRRTPARPVRPGGRLSPPLAACCPGYSLTCWLPGSWTPASFPQVLVAGFSCFLCLASALRSGYAGTAGAVATLSAGPAAGALPYPA